ncbi:hypothetical protein ABPG75_009865 [Micractinium tetrahymenae]
MTQLNEELRSSSSSSSGGDGPSEPEALQQLHEDLESLTAEQPAEVRPSLDGLDLPSLGAKGTGPRLFCGHVPKEVNDEMVRQHFSKWGTVNDVYFPRHKKTLKRRPFCFVTFANKEDAERALAESGLEIAGVAIKNLTMVEDRDKYYTNKHASARQALLQALKQLGPSGSNSAAAAGSAPAAAAALPAAAAAGVSSEQLSNLAAIMALEGVPSDVVLQTLGLPAVSPEAAALAAAAASAPAMSPQLGLDGAALLAQALSSPALSARTTYEQLARGSFDLRGSLDLRNSLDLRGSLDLAAVVQSARASLDLSSLQQGLAAVAAAQGLATPAYDGAQPRSMHAVDSRSTLASADTWSNAPSARTSMDASALLPVTAGFLASAGGLPLSGLQPRLSLDAALQLHQQHQQREALLASQARLAAAAASGGFGMPPMPPASQQAQQQNLSAVMHSSFYQPAAAPAPAPPPAPQPELQHSMSTVMSSGFYGGSAGAPPTAGQPPMPLRHSMADFRGAGTIHQPHASTSGLPFADATWAAPPALQPQHRTQHGHGTLAGYSTVLRPSIDRSGLPPLPPRSSNQDPAMMRPPTASGSPDTLRGVAANGWGVAGQRLVA